MQFLLLKMFKNLRRYAIDHDFGNLFQVGVGALRGALLNLHRVAVIDDSRCKNALPILSP